MNKSNQSKHKCAKITRMLSTVASLLKTVWGPHPLSTQLSNSFPPHNQDLSQTNANDQKAK